MKINELEPERQQELAYRVAKLFFCDQMSLGNVRAKLEKEEGRKVSPQNVYSLLQRSASFGFISFRPLREKELERDLCDRFGIDPELLYVVVDSTDVPRKAAELVFRFIRDTLSKGRNSVMNPIGIGFGPGGATEKVAKFLVEDLDSLDERPFLHLYALTGGGPADDPGSSPISFFNLFEKRCKKTALFAPSLVTRQQFEEMKHQPGVKEVFDAKKNDKISVVVTAMGDAPTDDDIESGKIFDLLSTALLNQHRDEYDKLKKRGYVANVQYRPIAQDGNAILEEHDDDYRAPTVLEIRDLQQMARDWEKFVILMARTKRPEAIIPILSARRDQRLFRTIVLDRVTADAVMRAVT